MDKNTSTKQQQQDTEQTKPIEKKEEVQNSNDEHIDQDFPGFPHLPATQENIEDENNDVAKA